MQNGPLSLDVYAVDLAELRELVGCKDDGLLCALTSRTKVSPWNEYKPGFEPSTNLLLPGLDYLVMAGAPPKGEHAAHCGHALRMLTSMYAKRLPVSTWNAFQPEALTAVDRELEQLGIKLRLSAQIKSGPPVRLPAHRAAPTIGHVAPDEVARTAKLLADAVAAANVAAAPAESCEMHKPGGKRTATWTGSIVGTDVVQVWRATSGKQQRQVSTFTNLDGARRTYEAYIVDRAAEGYVVHARTQPAKPAKSAKAAKSAKRAPTTAPRRALDTKALARIEEANTWYAAAARKQRGLMFFAF